MKSLGIISLFFLLFASTDAQFPPIGTIDFYGLRTISERQIREVLQIKEGNAMLKSKEEVDAIENGQAWMGGKREDLIVKVQQDLRKR